MFAEDDLIIHHLGVSGVWNWGKGAFLRLCFVFPKQGRGVYADQHATRELSAGDVLVLNTAAKGCIRSRGRERFAAAAFYAQIEHLISVLPLNELCLLERSARTLGAPLFYPSGSRLALKCHPLVDAAPVSIDAEHRCHVLRILAAVLADEFKIGPSPCAQGNGSRLPANRLLDNLSLEEIEASNIDELSARFACSRRHLNRLFHERFGISVSALKMEMRLLKALALLREPGNKVLSVALDCGFNHLSLFCSRFKKRFGASPNQWRSEFLSAASDAGVGAGLKNCPLESRGLCPLPGRNDQSLPQEKNRRKLRRHRVVPSTTAL